MSDSDSDSLSSDDGSGVKLTRLENQDTGGETVFIPSDLPIQDGMIFCPPSRDSTVSMLSVGLDRMSMYGAEPEQEEEDDDDEGGFGFQRGKITTIGEDLSFSDESEDEEDEESDAPPDPLAQYEKFKGKAITEAENQIVNDEYGDSGWYTGSVTVEALVPHGKGTMIYANSRIYNGDWEDGKWHGEGEWNNINGDIYTGSFKYEKRHGHGVYKWENGNEYDGEFKDDQRHGKGKFTFANGTMYEGDFANGNFEGKGTYSFGTGMYDGEWKGGKYHGQGFLLNADGSSYTGAFEAGLQHGQGEENQPDGSHKSGVWTRGRAPTQW